MEYMRRYTDEEQNVFLVQTAYAIDDVVNNGRKRWTFMPKDLMVFCGLSSQILSCQLRFFVKHGLVSVYNYNTYTNRYCCHGFDVEQAVDCINKLLVKGGK